MQQCYLCTDANGTILLTVDSYETAVACWQKTYRNAVTVKMANGANVLVRDKKVGRIIFKEVVTEPRMLGGAF